MSYLSALPSVHVRRSEQEDLDLKGLVLFQLHEIQTRLALARMFRSCIGTCMAKAKP